MRKVMFSVVALLLVCSAYNAFGQANPTELTIYVGWPEKAAQIYKSMAEHPVIIEFSKMYNYKLTFIHPPANDDGTFFNTTIASGVLPDLFMNNFSIYPGGPEGAVKDGVLINMNDLLKKHAPNHMARYNNAPPSIKKKMVTDSGMHVRVGTIFQPPVLNDQTVMGLLARKDIMDKLKLKTPTTTAEFLDVLRAIKKSGLVEFPLSLPKYTAYELNQWNPFGAAFGVNHSGFFVKNGKIVYSNTDPNYKTYIGFWKTLWDEKLIDPDFISKSRSDTVKLFQAARAGIALIHNAQVAACLDLGKKAVPEYDMVAIPVLKLKATDPMTGLGWRNESVNDRAWFVSATAKDKVAAIQFLDRLMDPKNNRMFAWGLATGPNPTYTEVNGVRQFTDFMLKNPNMDFSTARDRYTANYFQTAWDQDMESIQYGTPLHKANFATWTASGDMRDKPPTAMSFTADESRELAAIMSQINTYTEEMFYKYMMGKESLDTFSTAYTEQIKKLNIARATAIQQAAYDRFMKR